MNQQNEATLSDVITEGINKTLARELPNAGPDELEQRRRQMNKAELMDAYLQSFDREPTGNVIHGVVQRLFGIDLDHVSLLPEAEHEIQAAGGLQQSGTHPDGSTPVPREIIDIKLATGGKRWSGPEIRRLLNSLFGVNLDAISALDQAKISLFSKGQWVVRKDHDLFVVYTGEGDVDVSVYPTAYFLEQTGMDGLPEDLNQALTDLGYRPDGERKSLYYADPDGRPVPDAFKGQTMGAIMAAIRNSYSHL
ncbi:hypothetical protein RJP21_08215 [Paenibacillus sp. VCA1]|uniref:hypothetical protein n=1 Tax=Paenibacillus sp. VCA1 TaxID=3039148 RepID=UPI002872AA2C|nr:hypothetical protein [Paenibacillus sp. VCA1]MDR9853582.1 hypothetical protein [Paenibacillus sp. VCA1]